MSSNERLNTYKNVFYYFGESVSKIDAINRDMDKFDDFSLSKKMKFHFKYFIYHDK